VDLDQTVVAISTLLADNKVASRDNKAVSKVSVADSKATRIWDRAAGAVAQAAAIQVQAAWDQDKEKTIYNMPIDLPNKQIFTS
jgi:hypothetical protein